MVIKVKEVVKFFFCCYCLTFYFILEYCSLTMLH